MSIEKRLQELGITLPSAAAPLANYVPYVQEGTLIFISGQVPRGDDGQLKYVGKVGQELSVEDGYASARLCALNCLAQLRAALGSLDKVKRIVRVGGFVNCTDGFTQQPQVVNGASDLIVEVFGDKGRHARAAVGNNALPGNVATEVEMVAAVAP
jgi:enamine deaminase RidA (YjgF/YER057c/UK114 family)